MVQPTYNSPVCQLEIANFQGPFDLLWELIQKQKMSILEVNLNEIIEQYVDHINRWKKTNLRIASDYLVIAAQLLKIKSQELLPASVDDSKKNPESEREQLIKRLLEYKRAKMGSAFLQEQLHSTRHFLAKGESDLSPFVVERDDLPLPSAVNPEFLRRYFERAAFRLQASEAPLPATTLTTSEVSPEKIQKDLLNYLESRSGPVDVLEFLEASQQLTLRLFATTLIAVLDLAFRQRLVIVNLDNNQLQNEKIMVDLLAKE